MLHRNMQAATAHSRSDDAAMDATIAVWRIERSGAPC